jgi:hypothetical protein
MNNFIASLMSVGTKKPGLTQSPILNQLGVRNPTASTLAAQPVKPTNNSQTPSTALAPKQFANSPAIGVKQYGTTSATSPARQQYVNSLAQAPTGQNAIVSNPIQKTDPSSTPQNPAQTPSQTPINPDLSNYYNPNGPTKDPNTSYRDALNDYVASLRPSEEESRAKKNLADLDLQSMKDQEEALGRGETLGFAAGEAARVNKNNSFQRIAAANTLEALTGNRSAMSEGQKARLDFEKSILPKPAEPFNLGAGEDRYAYNSATGKYDKVASGAPKDKSITDQYGSGIVGEYNFAKSQGYTGSFLEYQKEKEGVDSGQDLDKLLSPTEAAALGVPYGTTKRQAMGDGSGNTDATGQKVLTPAQKTKIDAINIVSGQLQNYRNLIEKHTKGGAGFGSQLTGVAAAELRTAKSALEFAVANAVGTGALQAADRAVVMDLIPNPTGLLGALGGAIRGGYDGNIAALNQAESVFRAAENTIRGGQAVAPSSSQSAQAPSISPDEEAHLRSLGYTEQQIQALRSPQSFNPVGNTSASIPKTSRLASVNNNPGNLRYAGQPGASEGEGGFAKFPSVAAGVQALTNQIRLDASRGLSLLQFIHKYAPPTENDTQKYLQDVLAMTGAKPTTPLKNIPLDVLTKAVAKKESGTKIS